MTGIEKLRKFLATTEDGASRLFYTGAKSIRRTKRVKHQPKPTAYRAKHLEAAKRDRLEWDRVVQHSRDRDPVRTGKWEYINPDGTRGVFDVRSIDAMSIHLGRRKTVR